MERVPNECAAIGLGVRHGEQTAGVSLRESAQHARMRRLRHLSAYHTARVERMRNETGAPRQ